MFIAGAEDSVVTMMGHVIESQESTMPNLKKKVLIPGPGHWVQQEKPEEVNKLMIEFLKEIQL